MLLSTSRLISARLSCRMVPRHTVRFASTASEPPVMKQIRESLKDAMRTKDTARKDVIRAVMSTVNNANLESEGAVNSDIKFYDTIQSMIKKRGKAIEEYQAGDRKDLVEKEQQAIEILNSLASKVEISSEEEIESRVRSLAESHGIDPYLGSSTHQIMQKIPWKTIETDWKASRRSVVDCIKKLTDHNAGSKRSFSTLRGPLRSHENPLGIPRQNQKPNIPKSRPGQQVIEKKSIKNVKKVIVVSSAKGGVGKSTIAVNTALAMYNQGLSVGILDVDIFGPSIPKLLNLSGEPMMNDDNLLIPMQNYGIKAMSMGFLVDPQKAVAWRGLLVQKALQQLMFEVDWGNLDVLVLDLPPGTGDVQLTLAQQVNIDGAVIVSTPQDIALIDAIRGVDMFGKVEIPVLGLIQNMSLYICPNCNHQEHIFGSDGAIKEAEKREIDVLSSIPLNAEICSASDAGKPITVTGGPASDGYNEAAKKLITKLQLNQ